MIVHRSSSSSALMLFWPLLSSSDGHVEALQGLGDAFGQQGQQHEVPRTGRRAQVHVVFETQQALLDERFQPLVDHRVQFLQLQRMNSSDCRYGYSARV
jgi:hypothetical protein